MTYDEIKTLIETYNSDVAASTLFGRIERLRQSLLDITNMQPMWHGGVGPMPREHLLELIEGMKAEASAALDGQ